MMKHLIGIPIVLILTSGLADALPTRVAMKVGLGSIEGPTAPTIRANNSSTAISVEDRMLAKSALLNLSAGVIHGQVATVQEMASAAKTADQVHYSDFGLIAPYKYMLQAAQEQKLRKAVSIALELLEDPLKTGALPVRDFVGDGETRSAGWLLRPHSAQNRPPQIGEIRLNTRPMHPSNPTPTTALELIPSHIEYIDAVTTLINAFKIGTSMRDAPAAFLKRELDMLWRYRNSPEAIGYRKDEVLNQLSRTPGHIYTSSPIQMTTKEDENEITNQFWRKNFHLKTSRDRVTISAQTDWGRSALNRILNILFSGGRLVPNAPGWSALKG